MKNLFPRRPIAVSLLVILIAGALVIHSHNRSASLEHPKPGSITFGLIKDPAQIKSSAKFESFKTLFADIAENVVPTVVQVIPTKIDTVIFSNNPFYQFFGDPFGFNEFFGQSRQHQLRPPVEKRQYKQQGLGSGVVVSKEGYILTNYHVVAGADEIEVKTSDNRSFQADIVGVDSLSDVAVIKIKDKVDSLPVAYLGDSEKLRPGDWAIAIGNPFSFASSVTLGIVSAIGRTANSNSNTFQNFIQTDAAINPGNSGGALVNVNGELVGINTMIYTQSGGYMGIGFAIPINMARQIMEDLIYEGKVNRGWLGISIQDIDPASREAFNLKTDLKGVLVGDVFKGQAADQAGFKRGDIIISVNNKAIQNCNQLRIIIAAIHPGEKVPIEIIRKQKKIILNVRISGRDQQAKSEQKQGSTEPENKNENICTKLGIKAANITSEIRDALNVSPTAKGVIIIDINPDSQAAEEGIMPNDIILEINRKPVLSTKDFNHLLNKIKPGHSVLFLLQRDNNTFYKAFKIP
ncbi:MAG TPA: Do family serine endopeptidase [Chitinispirillaceae bacterium]|nr:Do family serine endopeptidase [Chitinispirillaceae bacterium]